jgi:hypothetical protein
MPLCAPSLLWDDAVGRCTASSVVDISRGKCCLPSGKEAFLEMLDSTWFTQNVLWGIGVWWIRPLPLDCSPLYSAGTMTISALSLNLADASCWRACFNHRSPGSPCRSGPTE